MDTLTHNPFDLSFNECADVDVVGFANGYESLMDLGLELRPHILAVEGHLGDDLFAKILREFFDMLDARILDFFPGYFLDRAQGHLRLPGNCLPSVTRMHSIQLP